MKSGKTDLLLINPGDAKSIYQSLGRNLAAVEPPVWAGLMASFVRGKGYSACILDANAEDLSADEAARRVKEENPLLIAVVVYGHQPSASTQNMSAAGEICSAIRKCFPTAKILLIGGHVAALPERTLREEKADFIAGGEGLWTLVDLLEALKNSHPDYSKVRGLYYLVGNRVQSNPDAPLLKDLDKEMPGVAWDLLPMEKYRAHNWHCFADLKRQPYASIYTTLGCPYHCSFCCIQAPFKSGEKQSGLKEDINSYRFWSPQMVIQQIDILVKKYGVRNIKIADEMFVLNLKHVMGICDLIIERKYDLNIWAYARVDTVKDEMIAKMKRAGIHWLAFGIESGNAHVRDVVNKGFTQDDIFRTVMKVREAGINVIGNYIFGLPDDTQDSMQATLDLAMELNCEFANFYCAMAYPGSQLYTQAIHDKFPLPIKWSGYSQHSFDALPLPTKYLSSMDVLRFRDHAFYVYFSNPKYLRMINHKFGTETEQHIREMLSYKLERQNV